MPRQVYGYPSSINSTLLFFALFVLAFFPNLFIGLLKLPLRPFISSPTNPLPSPTPSCSCTPTYTPEATMSWFQKTLALPPKSRGSYLITDHITKQLPEIKNYKVGILHLFVQHTSCALSMNENWDEEVREDMSDALERIVPFDKKGNMYRHSAEGDDDMPAHIKSALIGSSVTIPITDGKLATGTWQGGFHCSLKGKLC